MPRALRSSCDPPARHTTATIALCSWLAAVLSAAACLPEEITYRLEDDPSSASSGGSGGGGGPCVDDAPDGGAGGAGGSGGGGEACVRCWPFALSGETGKPCTCSAVVYQAYRSCICTACPDCTLCGGRAEATECSSCYQKATEEACREAQQACVDD